MCWSNCPHRTNQIRYFFLKMKIQEHPTNRKDNQENICIYHRQKCKCQLPHRLQTNTVFYFSTASIFLSRRETYYYKYHCFIRIWFTWFNACCRILLLEFSRNKSCFVLNCQCNFPNTFYISISKHFKVSDSYYIKPKLWFTPVSHISTYRCTYVGSQSLWNIW